MWKCPKCETLNDDSGAFCFICNESKPVYQPSVSRPDVYAAAPRYEANPGTGEFNNGWIIGLAIGVSVFITLIILIALV